MSINIKLPTREEAEKLLEWAEVQNPGAWVDHSKVVARASEAIALASGLDSHKAYVLGLLHDIGRYEGVVGLHHIYSGYQLMNEKGFTQIADICLSHSFSYKNLYAYSGPINDCTDDELHIITEFLSNKTFDDYDKLIQLTDAMCLPQGVTLIEVRLVDVTRRHGFNSFTLKKWEHIFSLKKYFDKLCNQNIYELFHKEISSICLQ